MNFVCVVFWLVESLDWFKWVPFIISEDEGDLAAGRIPSGREDGPGGCRLKPHGAFPKAP